MKKLLGLTLVLVVLLSGCVQYKEHLTLDRQGSGTLTFKMGVMDMGAMFGDDLDGLDEPIIEDEEELENYPGITVVDIRSYSDEGMEWQEMTLEFESLDILNEAMGSSGFSPMGIMSFSQEGGHLMFRKALPALSEEFGDVMDDEEMPIEMFYMFFDDMKWVYEITFPGRIVESNAQDEEVDLATNTIRWSHQMLDLLSEETEMWAEIKL